MFLRNFLKILFISILAVFCLAFMSGLPSFFSFINLPVVVLIFILGLYGLPQALFWGFGLGLIFDVYSFLPFGVHLFSYVLILWLANFLLVSFLTNRTLYSFWALIIFSDISFLMMKYLLSGLVFFVTKNDLVFDFSTNFWLYNFYGLLLDLLLVAVIFNALNYLGKRVGPVFLRKGSLGRLKR
jgi:rod shape-determining protein MreD